MSYNPTKHNPWQSQKLSQAKISIICPFFYLSEPKQINNFQCIHFIQQGNLTVHFGMTDVKNNCIFLSCPCAYLRNNFNTYSYFATSLNCVRD